MPYFTLDRRFTIVYGIHFILFIFTTNIMFPFLFIGLPPLQFGLKEHIQNAKFFVLHEGLILLIVKHFKTPPSPSKKPTSGRKKNVLKYHLT